jgi:hypothetical protein
MRDLEKTPLKPDILRPGSGSTTCCGPLNCTDYPKKLAQWPNG